MSNLKVNVLAVLVFVFSFNGVAQHDNVSRPTFNVSGSMQFWLRYTELNPGSEVFGEERNSTWDVSVRRYRLNFSGRVNDQLKYCFVLGNNNLNYSNASMPHVLDAYVDYELKKYLAVGIGKQSWTGLSRFSAFSSTKGLGYDIDLVAAPFVNVYDDLLRKNGVYARGQWDGFDYRIALAKPSFYNPPTKIGENATFSNRKPEYQLSAYAKYQFLDHESQGSAYSAGTYLGEKHILNIGAGFLQQPNTTWYLTENDTSYHQAFSYAVDLFYEKPLSGNRGITAYLAYIDHDFGKNFIRNIAVNNPATSSAASSYVNGSGNATPVVGTGQMLYLQFAYIRPAIFNSDRQIQPYGSLQYARFEALDDPVLTCNAGLNYFLDGHDSKLTIGYQSRPVFEQAEHLVKEGTRKGMVVVQYQVVFGD